MGEFKFNDISYYYVCGNGTMLRKLDSCIKKVIFNGPATIVIWDDGKKTVVKCMDTDDYDPEKGLMMCIMEYLLGSKSQVKKFFEKHIPEENRFESLLRIPELLSAITKAFTNTGELTKKDEEENKDAE